MNLFFFGSSARQLFGAYHTPRAGVPVRGAAVLCPPWGLEYFVSHRILRRLATRLSEDGYHVLRFDYFGSGDSAGEREEGDLGTWLDDASVAVDELRDLSGMPTVATIGIRLGAVIGRRLATTRPDVRSVVMWDPILNGAEYVSELLTTQAEIDRWSLSPLPIRRPDGVLEVLGNPLTPAMRRSIEAITVADFAVPPATRLALFHSEALTAEKELRDALAAAGATVCVESVPGQAPWRQDVRGPGGMAYGVLQRIVELQP